MSQQIYWGVISNRKRGKSAHWPQRFHFRAHDAKAECHRLNEFEKQFKHPIKYHVERYMLDFKAETHYDVYKHEVKRI